MKAKSLYASIFFIGFTFQFAHSQITLADIKAGRLTTQEISTKSFTFTIIGVGGGDKISIFEDGNSANKNNGDKQGNRIKYRLDDLVKDLEPQGSIKLVVHDDNTDKDLASFTVKLTSTGTSPIANARESEDYEIPIAFYDAKAIYLNIVSDAPFAYLFTKYNFDFSGAVTIADSIEVLRKNVFVKVFIDSFYQKKRGLIPSKATVAEANSALSGALSALGGIDVTKYVQAAADFLRDRIKEELTIAFIDRFRRIIDSIPELKALLPRTYNVFNSSDPFKIPTMGQTYRTAFQTDLENFVENFELFIDTTTLQRYAGLKTNQAVTAFRIGYHTIDMSANNFHPIDIFEFIDAKFGYDKQASRVQEINKYVSLLNLISQNLRKREDLQGIGWISSEDLKKFHPNAILAFWGLMYQQKPEVFDEIKVNDITLANHLLKGSLTAQVYLKQFVVLTNNIGERIKNFNESAANSSNEAEDVKEKAVQDFVANADRLVDVADFIFSFPHFRDPSSFHASEYYKKWRPVLVDVVETTKGINAKNYSKIVVSSTSLIVTLITLNGSNNATERFIKNLTFYSNFMVDAINAEKPDDVKAVLNRYAQPVGSYRIKRKTSFSVSVNAYPGIYYGWETYKDAPDHKTSNRTFGVTAPIGLSFNWGNWPWKGYSSSIYLNAVDIAAALSFRWSNDTLDLPQTITLAQIFAPGAFVVLGFPNVPISARMGVQYVPQLRSITKDGNKIDEISTLRFGISAVVDIPFFNFYNKSIVYR